MAGNVSWKKKQRELLWTEPLLMNVIVGLILLVLEKLMEVEFRCPCKRLEYNLIFPLMFFILPAILAFTMMLLLQECRCTERGCCSKTVWSCVPAIVWLLLLFFDGRYLACAMTTWEGRFVEIEKFAKMKWCDPNVTSSELMTRSQHSYYYSQVAGIVVLFCFCVGLIIYQIVQCVKAQEVTQPGGDPQAQYVTQPGGDPQAQDVTQPGGDPQAQDVAQAGGDPQAGGVTRDEETFLVSEVCTSQASGGLTPPNTTALQAWTPFTQEAQEDTQHVENIPLSQV